VTGHPTAPKYLNPPTTATYQKSRSTYWPLGRPANPSHTIIVVEGFIDALAIAGAGTVSDPLFPCSTGGIAVSPRQASEVASLTTRPVLLALDADPAGRAGTERWQRRLAPLNRSTRTIQLPQGKDPAALFATTPTSTEPAQSEAHRSLGPNI
jgi:DNA primase